MDIRGELFQRYPGNPILTAADWLYPVNSVFNPGATQIAGQTLLLVRVEDYRGFSHLTSARSANGIDNWIIDSRPTLEPDIVRHPEEIYGIEDPRVTYLEEMKLWAVVYTSYSRGGPLVSLALTKDFEHFERLGSVMPPEDKDSALFPRKFGGRWAMLHRPVSGFTGVGVHVWISFSPDLKHWGDHQVVIQAHHGGWWDANKIGLSPPPLWTPEGWLILYHAVRETPAGALYRLGLALLDLDDPCRVISRSDRWVFSPREEYERNGDVGYVVFPCGWVQKGDELFIYYGGADTCVALAVARIPDILEYLKQCPKGDWGICE